MAHRPGAQAWHTGIDRHAGTGRHGQAQTVTRRQAHWHGQAQTGQGQAHADRHTETAGTQGTETLGTETGTLTRAGTDDTMARAGSDRHTGTDWHTGADGTLAWAWHRCTDRRTGTGRHRQAHLSGQAHWRRQAHWHWQAHRHRQAQGTG
jgi:hypothetical protein